MAVLRTLAVLAAVFVALTACGDDEQPDDEQPDSEQSDAAATNAPATGVEGAEAVVRAFYERLGAGDFDGACATWTEEYAASSVSDWNERNLGDRVADCPELLGEFIEVLELVGDAAHLLDVADAAGELRDATTAHVDVTVASGEDETDTFEVTLTDDGWLISGEVLADPSTPPTGSAEE